MIFVRSYERPIDRCRKVPNCSVKARSSCQALIAAFGPITICLFVSPCMQADAQVLRAQKVMAEFGRIVHPMTIMIFEQLLLA